MNLAAAISDLTPAWEILLGQIGLPFRRIDTGEPLPAATTPVLIATSQKNISHKNNIIRYLRDGGTVLTDAGIAKKLLDVKTRRTRIQFLAASEADEIFSETPICGIALRSQVSENAAFLPNQLGQPCVSFIRIGEGAALVLPSGLISAAAGMTSKRINFPSAFSERPPSEQVCAVPRGSIRKIAERSLEYLYHFRKLPFVKKWPFPDGEAGIFGFRVDTDFCSQEQAMQLYAVCRKHGIRGTWFVETKSQATWMDTYKTMAEQEIGYHCYRHRVFANEALNTEDFQEGLGIMKKAGITPKGYAAPFGEWHPGLNKLLGAFNFDYSSEFSAGYDDLPFYPILNQTVSKFLQIPIHPISVGRLFWARTRAEGMVKYFQTMLAEKLALQEPAIIYHHPGQKRWDLFDKVFQKADDLKLGNIPLHQYAAWWKKRAENQPHLFFKNDKLILDDTSFDPTVWLQISLPSGENWLNSAANAVNLLQGGKRIEKAKLLNRYDPVRLAKYTTQMLVHDINWRIGKLKQ